MNRCNFFYDTFIGDVLQVSEFLGTLREYWNVNEFLSFVIKFLSHYEFDFILIFEQGCDMSEGHIRRGTLVRVLGTAPALAMGPCCRFFLPSVVCRGENQSENQTGANGVRRRRNGLWSCSMQRRAICSRVLTPRSTAWQVTFALVYVKRNALMADRS